MNRLVRKKKHLKHLDNSLSDLRLEIINTVVSSSDIGLHIGAEERLMHLGALIRKYERRRKLLKF